MSYGTEFAQFDLSVAMTSELADDLRAHFDKGPRQEDLTFALWRPSQGGSRYTAILQRLVLPEPGDRALHNNVAFLPGYVQRVLHLASDHYGVALLHSHLGPGWQDMSGDDVVAERDRLAPAVLGRTGLPLVGLTWGTDGAWSGRFWLRHAPRIVVRRWARTVRVVGRQLAITYHPEIAPSPVSSGAQVATVSVWGEEKQADLARVHIGVVGLGSVGSVVAETLSRVGISRLTLIDHDRIEERNLDRTLGAFPEDASARTPKVEVSRRLITGTHTAAQFEVEANEGSVLSPAGLSRVLDCDVLFSCVDRPWPRHLLNAVAYAHLVPVVDGGVLAKVDAGRLLHADWRIHTIGPCRPCMVCVGALTREGVALDREGKLDDPTYIQGLGPAFNLLIARQNVFPFSLSVAAHEVLQCIGLITGQPRVGGLGPQMYHCYPGSMDVDTTAACAQDCDYAALTATASDLIGNCLADRSAPENRAHEY